MRTDLATDNHKPVLSSDNAPEQARLRPAIAGQTSSYDLSYSDNGPYAFAGTRNTNNNQYVLHFDPRRKAFILDRVDSTFDMNLTRTPATTDPDALSNLYPHIGKDAEAKANPAAAPKPKPKTTKNKASGNVFAKAPAKAPTKAAPAKKEAPRKPEKKEVKNMTLALPVPEAPKPKAKPRKVDDDDEEEEEDDGDDGLLIEYPGAEPKSAKSNPPPAFTAFRRFDEAMDQRDSAAEEVDSESDEEHVDRYQGAGHHEETQSQSLEKRLDHMEIDTRFETGADEDDDMGASFEDDLEKDLEKDLEDAFEDLENSQNGSPDGDESDISEEE